MTALFASKLICKFIAIRVFEERGPKSFVILSFDPDIHIHSGGTVYVEEPSAFAISGIKYKTDILVIVEH
ncbi:hypothetical protein D3C81_953820 [compost metagenome]